MNNKTREWDMTGEIIDDGDAGFHITFSWYVGDVLEIAPCLSYDEAQEVLLMLCTEHEVETGVTGARIEECCNKVMCRRE